VAKSWVLTTLALGLVALTVAVPGSSAKPAAAAQVSNPATSDCYGREPGSATPPASSDIVIRCLYPASAGLGDRITVGVDNLQAELDAAGGCGGLVLFVDGLPLTGVAPDRCDPADGHVGFILTRNSANTAAWNHILGKPKAFQRNVGISVGSSSTRSYPSAPGVTVTLRLTQIPRAQFWVFLLLALGTVGLVGWLALRTTLLRDPNGDPGRPPNKRPFSLGRTQQAFWFTLAVLAYVFVYLVTSNLDSLSNSTLLLIAISGGTALGSEAIGRSGNDTLVKQLATLQASRATAEAQRAAAGHGPASAPALTAATTQLMSINAQIASVTAALTKNDSKGFFRDLVDDENGVSLQRLQVLVWTVVLGCIFINEVYAHLTMPDFSASLLTLMGISSGTYLAGKSSEVARAAAPVPVLPLVPADVTP
jgi:hypothetical protein